MVSLTFAIGDVHGCLGKLKRLLKVCEARASGHPARFVFLGDYVDRGPDSRGVVEYLRRRQQSAPGQVICLMGNHEQLAVAAQDDERAMPIWLANSGAATQRSYWRSGGRIEPAHLGWLRALPLCHDDGLRFFVHAGVDLAVPLERQRGEVMLWVREPFLSDCDKVDCGRFIVHGHTPRPEGVPELTRRRVDLDTGAVIGGPLTAAMFDDTRAQPLAFLTDRDVGWRRWVRRFRNGGRGGR